MLPGHSSLGRQEGKALPCRKWGRITPQVTTRALDKGHRKPRETLELMCWHYLIWGWGEERKWENEHRKEKKEGTQKSNSRNSEKREPLTDFSQEFKFKFNTQITPLYGVLQPMSSPKRWVSLKKQGHRVWGRGCGKRIKRSVLRFRWYLIKLSPITQSSKGYQMLLRVLLSFNLKANKTFCQHLGGGSHWSQRKNSLDWVCF